MGLSIYATVVIVHFKTLKPFDFQLSILLQVFKKKEKPDGCLFLRSVQQNSSVSIVGTDFTVVFKTLNPFFQLSILQQTPFAFERSPRVYFD